MIKRWLVKCMANMYQTNDVNVIVNAQTKAEAKHKAEKELYNKGYLFVHIKDVEEITEKGEVKNE